MWIQESNTCLILFFLMVFVFNFGIMNNEIFAADENVITDPSDIPLILLREPSNFSIKEVDNVNVLYQYGMPVPSFDTWKSVEDGRQHLSLNGEWKFSFEDIEYEGILFKHNQPFKNDDLLMNSLGMVERWYSPSYEDSDWKKVEVPHVWDLEDIDVEDWYNSSLGFNADKAFRREFGWYRKTIKISEDFIKNRYVRINTLGIETQAWVFVNGQYVGAHEGGYDAFSMDISQYLKVGKNTIAIRVWRRPQKRTEDPDISLQELGNNQYHYKDVRSIVGPGGPFPYGGIKREIWIESTDKVSVSKILTRAEDGLLDMYAVLYNAGNQERAIELQFDPGTGDEKVYKSINIKAGETRVVKKTLNISSADNWSYVDPNLYQAKVGLKEEGVLIDSLTVEYGMRKIEIKEGNLYLNGNRILLKGFVWYEDFNPETVIAEKETYEFHLEFIKNKLEANFLRGHPYHPKAKETADEVGILLMEEQLNNWLTSFLMNYQLRQYRLSEALTASKVWNNLNHPSIIIWSLANELGDFETSTAERFINTLNKVAKKLDVQKRPTTFCLRGHGQYTNSMAQNVDIYSFNTKRSDYSDKSSQEKAGNDNKEGDGLRYTLNQITDRFPDKPILFSEAGPSWTKELGGVNPNIFRMWDFILKEEYPVIGFAYWSYNDFKTGLGNFRGGGFTHSGIVKQFFNEEYVNNAQKTNMPYMVWLGHNFHRLYNPYAYPQPDEEKMIYNHEDDSIWTSVDFSFGNLRKVDSEIKGSINLRTYDMRKVSDYINKILPLQEKYGWLNETVDKFEYPEDHQLKDVQIKVNVSFYGLDAGDWEHISTEKKLLNEISELGKDFQTINYAIDLPETEASLLRTKINVQALINGIVVSEDSHTKIF